MTVSTILAPQQEGELLRESQALATALFESSADCVKLLDTNGQLTAMNAPGMCAMEVDDFGSVEGQLWTSLWPEALRPELERALEAAKAGGIGRLYGLCPTAKGTPKWWDVQVSAVRTATGRHEKLLVVSRDMTEHAHSQNALSESEARFRNMADHAPLIMWVTEPDGSCSYLNRGWYEFTGQSEEEALGLGWTKATHPEDQKMAGDAFLAAVATQGPFHVEYRLRRADGTYRWAIDTAAPRFGDDGQFLGHVGSVIDIDERRETEEALRQALEQKVDAAVVDRDRTWNNARDLLLVVGSDGVFRAVNPAWTAILGWQAHELVGCSYLDFIHPDDHPSSEVALEVAAAQDLPVYENRYRHKNGEYRWISWVAAPEGDMIYASGRDITASKEQEAALQLAEEQLRQSQKMEAVGQLTGGIAHDFNNLLQGITGSLDLVQKRIAQGRTGEVQRFVSGAVTSANRAAALTHRLLAFSRRQPLDPKPIAANPLVASMEDLLRRTLGETIELELVLAGGLWPTLCDGNQLESALLNLAINARDAMPEGGKLTIETCNAHLDTAYAARARDVTPGQYVCVCVTDSGSGMSPEVIERAFDPFFTTKAIGQGTGLGLSMIYGFARQSEGHCKIYSEVGRGTTIKLYLPRYRGDSVELEAIPSLSDAPGTEHGEVVVVIEDEPIVRGLIVEVLHELGYRALEAHDGPSGLALIEATARVDLVITDIGLPGLNGRQVVDAARVKRPNLKVLFMTGYAENAALANGFLEPGMSMLTKPFAMEALATRIRSIIEAV